MKLLRIGVVGLGFGENHVKTLVNLEGATLAAIADTIPERCHRLGSFYGVSTYTDGVEMMSKEELDGVILCVPPKYREPLIREAADRGISLFVEKPWATNVTHARLLGDICKKSGVKVMMGFSFRFHAVVQKLIELMQGELGAGWLVNAEYVFDWLPASTNWLWDPGDGNGFFNENSCHIFDVLCAVMGKPETVSAVGGKFIDRPSEVAGAVTMTFPGGGIGCVTIGGVGTSTFKSFPRLDVCTENGSAKLRGSRHNWRQLEWALRGDQETSLMTDLPEELGSTRYTEALTRFVKMIRSEEKPAATIEDGILTVAIAEAVYQSISQGKTVRISDILS
jgi:predicted dehydrogenase